MSFPLTHRRTPSSVVVEKRYDPVLSATTWPVQRTENVSGAMELSGEPVDQEKFTVCVGAGDLEVREVLVVEVLTEQSAAGRFGVAENAQPQTLHPRHRAGVFLRCHRWKSLAAAERTAAPSPLPSRSCSQDARSAEGASNWAGCAGCTAASSPKDPLPKRMCPHRIAAPCHVRPA